MLRANTASNLIGRMIRPAFSLLLFALMGCQMAGPATPGKPQDLRSELVTKTGNTPPQKADGLCWADDVIPAVIETVTEQVLIRPELRREDGTLLQAAAFRTNTAQRIVQERREVWFRVPCDEVMTLEFVASLQRALKARGYYKGAPTGQFDPATRLAIRQYQAPLGLDSGRLSLAAARGLGLVAGNFAR